MEDLKYLEPIRKLAISWNRKQEKASKGENAIIEALRRVNYEVMKYIITPEEEKISIERKKEKLKEHRFPDCCAFYHGFGKPVFDPCFFFDSKFKSKKSYLGIVNVVDYDGYFAFLRHGEVKIVFRDFKSKHPFKIFFSLKDVNEIWIHNLRDPKSEPNLESTIEFFGSTKVYRIPLAELELWKRVITD